jgi:cullin 1
MCEVFKAHIITLGSDMIQRRGAKLETIPEKERERDVPGGAYDPQFMKDILALHSKYGALVSTSFAGNGLFQRSLKDAFTDIVNRELTGSPVTFADVLATYADRMLRSGSAEKLSDAEIESTLSQVRLYILI